MESIKGHPEFVETMFGEAIIARDESLVVLAGACGLGPPDLCWLQKNTRSALTGASGEAKGYYHCCLGVDASSSAAVAAYFATLTSLVEPPTFLQGLFSTTEVRIERGFYCCYDPLTRLDVRCELCIPGGVVCGALDCEGNVHDVTPDLWRNCVVATFLRSELYDAELVSYSSVPVARYPPLPMQADETRLLTAVAGLYEDGVLPEALEALTVDQAGGVAPEHGDVVLHTLLHYFAKRQRWGTALEFFARLSATYPTAALYVAAVQRECGLYEEALATLSRAVEEAPDDPLLLAGLATEMLYSDQVESALRFAIKAARLRPQLRASWLAMARAHVRMGAGPTALVVLNLVPPPPVPGKEEAMLHVVVAPEPKSVTKPAIPAYDLDVVSARQVLAEEVIVHPPASASGSGGAAGGAPATVPTLPGALMVPREAPDAAAAPDTSPLRITKAVLAAVYTVLQELVAVSGWDGFLRLRSSVFVMHADSDVLREQQREAEERERQLKLLHRQLSATLPPSPSWVPQPPVPVPAPQAVSRRPPPEGVGFESALDDAAVMGLADYPEHLEDDYDDPRVIAAREAHRRHLREIAERQAKLEAAEGGAYADDEWDGSSGSDGGGAGGGGRAAGGGGPRSATSRSRRKGRKTPGRRAHVVAAADQGTATEEQQQQPGEAEEDTEVPEPGPSGTAAGTKEAVTAGAAVAKDDAAASGAEPNQELQLSSVGVVLDTGGGAASAHDTAPQASAPQPAASSLGWWGALFGGGGVADTAKPQRREAGPLGEACEVAAARGPCRTAVGPHSGAPRRVSLPLALKELRCLRSASGVAGHNAATGGHASRRASRWAPCRAPTANSAVPVDVRAAATAVAAAGDADWLAAMPIGALEDSWWQPAPATTAPAAAQTVFCTPLAPLRVLPSRPAAPAEGPSAPQAEWSAGRGFEVGTAARRRNSAQQPGWKCCQAESNTGRRQQCTSWLLGRDAADTVPPGGSVETPPRGLWVAMLCLLKARSDMYRWRRRQRKLQRALLQAVGDEQWPYRPTSTLLPSPSAGFDQAAAPAALAAWKTALGSSATTCPATVAAAGSRGLRISQRWSHGRFRAVRHRNAGPVAEAEGGDAEGGTDPVAAAGVEGPVAVVGGGGGGGGGASEGVDDSFPLVLQNHDADRQMILEGLDVTELGAKRLCARWLDELIVALWHDLQAFLDWKALDSELNDAGFRSHAEIVAGVAPAPTAADYQRAPKADTASTDPSAPAASSSVPPPPALPTLPAVEWLRRGLLAERLHHDADALVAYQAAVMTPPPPPGAAGGGSGSAATVFGAVPGGGPGAFSMIAWQAIMRLAPAGDPRDISWGLRATQAVMNWLESRSPAGTTAVPFTTGFLTSAAAAAGAAAAATRAAPAAAAAAVSTGGGKLYACPLSVAHCLHLVAAVLGESGVEATLQGQLPSVPASPAAGTAGVAPQRSGASGTSGAKTGSGGGLHPAAAVAAAGAVAVQVHPAAGALLRYAVQAAAAAAAAAGRGTTAPTAVTQAATGGPGDFAPVG